jgi:transcriptional regulator GlxA family with amidase domain
MLEVTVLLLRDNYASTALGPIEVFHSAGLLWNTLHGENADPQFNVSAVSVDDGPVRSPYGVDLASSRSIADVEHTDLIVVPASGLNLDAQLRRYRAMLPWLREWHEKGAYVAGICSGAAYLAEAGLLDGRQATTHWGVAESYTRRYPNVRWRTDMFITEDQRVLCSGGVYAAIDLSLYLVEKFCGHEIALRCAKSLLVDMPRINQSGYAVLPLSRPHSDSLILAVEEHMRRHYSRDLPIELLADRANVSARTFIRRFKKATGQLPGHYMQTLRINVAKQMLEEGIRSVQTVSTAVGYDDVSYFRKLFKRFTGMTPVEYRMRFRGSGAIHPDSRDRRVRAKPREES